MTLNKTITYFKADPKRRYYPGQIVDVIRVLPGTYGLNLALPCRCMLLSMHRSGRAVEWWKSAHKEATDPGKRFYVNVRLLINCKVIKTVIADCELNWYISAIS